MHSEIEVWIPADSCEERKYSIDVLFSDFLGIPYQLMIDDRILDYHIRCGNRELVIRDRFWGIYKGEPLAWLTEAALPKVSFLTNCPYIPEKDIRIGDTVLVQKAGEIIPEVVRVIKEKRLPNSAPYHLTGKCPV